MGIVTPQAIPTYPHGFPHDVIDPFMHRTGRGVLGNRPASGTEIIQELGEEHQRTGKWIVYTSADSVFQIAAHEDTIPLEELYGAAEIAREILTGKHAVGRVIARPFTGEPGNYERTPNRHDFSLEPTQPELPDPHPRGRAARCTASARSATSSPAATSTSRIPTKSNIEGIQQTERLLRELDEGFVFMNLVETDMLWGHRNDPVNFHRCLQDFDCRLPDLLDALRPGDLLDDHVRPRLRPDDAVDRPLARARAAARLRRGPERGGADPRGRVRRRRRDRQRLARRQGARARHPGPADRRRRERLDDPLRRPRASTPSEERLAKRESLYRTVTRRVPTQARSPCRGGRARPGPRRVLEVGCGDGRARGARSQHELGGEVVAVDHVGADGRARARPRDRRARRPTCRRFPFADGELRLRRRGAGCSTTCPISIAALARAAHACSVPAGRLVAATNSAPRTLRELWDLIG